MNNEINEKAEFKAYLDKWLADMQAKSKERNDTECLPLIDCDIKPKRKSGLLAHIKSVIMELLK